MLHPNLRRVHRTSALLLAAFACAHIGNHLWALRGAAAHLELMDGLRLIYRHPLVESLLLASAGVQCVSGWGLVVSGWRRRTGWLAWLQAASGAGLASFLLVHVASVLYGRSVLGLDTNFYFAAAGLHAGSRAWFFGPYYFLAVIALFTHFGCALAWQVKAPSAQARRWVVGTAVLLGTAAAASIVASLAGMTEPADIPVAYKARYGASVAGVNHLGRPCCLTKECYRREVVVVALFSCLSWSKAVGMWAKGTAVGNAARCPRSCPVRRRRIVHMSTAWPGASRPAPLPRCDADGLYGSVASVVDWLSLPRIRSLAFSARQALTRRCSVRSCALPA